MSLGRVEAFGSFFNASNREAGQTEVRRFILNNNIKELRSWSLINITGLTVVPKQVIRLSKQINKVRWRWLDDF